ncbi:hypothetical protein DPMN_061209 [Dreissena polymorpha]|uniref:Uncharacterized protein n=1 Tax=Dreissena polymorpha TaxID=45954 RepID=A0A9D4C706_DREPO|nr:hypothetical protein DPMN_061209 [Dreissena polymorpha]
MMDDVLLLKKTDHGPSKPSLLGTIVASCFLPSPSSCMILQDQVPQTNTCRRAVTCKQNGPARSGSRKV